MERVREATDGAGADVILDIMGAPYLDRNVDALAADGRLVIIGMQGGVKAELNVGKLLGKRAGVIATALRSRPGCGPRQQERDRRRSRRNVWPMIADGRVRPIIGAEFPIEQAGGGTRAAGFRRRIRQSPSARADDVSRATPAREPAGRPRRSSSSAPARS